MYHICAMISWIVYPFLGMIINPFTSGFPWHEMDDHTTLVPCNEKPWHIGQIGWSVFYTSAVNGL